MDVCRHGIHRAVWCVACALNLPPPNPYGGLSADREYSDREIEHGRALHRAIRTTRSRG